MFSKQNSLRILSLVITLIILATSFMPFNSKSFAQGGESETATNIVTEVDTEADYTDVAPLSKSEQDALYSKLIALREKTNALVDNHVSESPESEGLAVGETSIGSYTKPLTEAFLPLESTFYIGRNQQNTPAKNGSNSTLAEPVVVNDGIRLLYGGNWHFESSPDRGTTWTNFPIPAGPADAPFGCCDPDVVYDRARGLTIWAYLYINSGSTNGAVRIFVNRRLDTGYSCSYTIDPAGAADNLVPDYPHLGLSNDFLYLTTNNIGAGTQSAQVRRYPLEQLGNCVGASTGVYTYPWIGSANQRVFVPVQGAREVMYWGALTNSTTFRVYSWPENSGTISWVDRTIATSNFTNPDCRGGTGNYDFIERSTSWSIAGFRMRGAVGPNGILFLWNVGSDASHPQGHLHAARFKESDKTLIDQPHIWNSGACFGYPALSVNDRGDYGLSLAYGGKSGGGGAAAQGAVGLDDDFTSGISFNNLIKTASGTHNRSDSRFGDYFTVRPLTPCGNWFSATNYALLDGTSGTNVNARYVEFGRGRDYACWYGWTSAKRIPLP